MSRRFFTSDWHLGHPTVCKFSCRPWKTVDKMNDALISRANSRAGDDDIIIHIGDFCCYGNDRGETGGKVHPSKFISKINATFVNVMGNHDPHNKVKSIATYMRTSLGRFPNVSISHYPSTDPAAAGTFRKGDIHLCGHVHGAWRYFVDLKNEVLNINVGIDKWQYNIIAEDELISYIEHIINGNSIKE